MTRAMNKCYKTRTFLWFLLTSDGRRIISRHCGTLSIGLSLCGIAIALSQGSTGPDHNSNKRGRSPPLTRLEGFGPATDGNCQLLMRTGNHLSLAIHLSRCLCFHFARFCGFTLLVLTSILTHPLGFDISGFYYTLFLYKTSYVPWPFTVI